MKNRDVRGLRKNLCPLVPEKRKSLKKKIYIWLSFYGGKKIWSNFKFPCSLITFLLFDWPFDSHLVFTAFLFFFRNQSNIEDYCKLLHRDITDCFDGCVTGDFNFHRDNTC